MQLDKAVVNQPTSTFNLSSSERPEISFLEPWEEARAVFPIYLALTKQLYEAVRAQGYGRKGTQALLLALEHLSNIKR